MDSGAWRLLWLPPALPYYQLAGVYADPELRRFTKQLVFSSWRVVPKAIATLISYEAERRMMLGYEQEAENTAEARARRRSLLRLDVVDGRPTGMPVLSMLYPSVYLARECDPFALTWDRPTVARLIERVEKRIEHDLNNMTRGRSGPEDERWYWAGPMLLDRARWPEETRAWLESWDSTADAADAVEAGRAEESSSWKAHIAYARDILERPEQLGAVPADLPLVLALLGIAGPGTLAMRALWRIIGRDEARLAVRTEAARVAWGFRSLFNMVETMALVRGHAADTSRALELTRGSGREKPYWRQVLEYCAAGGLQAVLDEYVHVLREGLGLLDKPADTCARELAQAIGDALNLRTVTIGVDELSADATADHVISEPHRMRSHFALRFGEERADDGRIVTRAEQVRQAFNSPFWPFVLATTSVGQEGLDFHTYCHAVVHWNLPANPVDLEQREGRVHRYKGHAVRKNLARHYGHIHLDQLGDPWEQLFTTASAERTPGSNDLVPYWIYTVPGGAQIERHVPALPLSRDYERMEALRQALVVYRMVFGQPRQEDLLAYLLSRLPHNQIARFAEELRINLEPPVNGEG